MMQQHAEHTSEEESHDHDADDVLPDTMKVVSVVE